MDWAKHTTVVAAMVAAAGLGVTAWGTLISARVAEDQLVQSKVQSEERTRRQASRITYWEEGDEATVVANRSLDPVNLYLTVNYFHAAEDPNDAGRGQVLVAVGTLPPCSRLAIPEAQLEGVIPNEEREGFYVFSVSEISFTDTYGQRWTRDIDGTLTHGWPELPNRELGDVREFMKWLKGASRKMSALDECGAAT
ncbi:hypothetical protein [Streptomyces sp. NPDC085937]|uniref:hypothetical protein n=1 Tax=Streptomyces sp. NPDC085937 TaxID=3365742 RepID=UPI0037D3A90E